MEAVHVSLTDTSVGTPAAGLPGVLGATVSAGLPVVTLTLSNADAHNVPSNLLVTARPICAAPGKRDSAAPETYVQLTPSVERYAFTCAPLRMSFTQYGNALNEVAEVAVTAAPVLARD